MLRQSIAVSTINFWRPAKFENVEYPDFGNIKHLQNLGHFLLNAPDIYQTTYGMDMDTIFDYPPYQHSLQRWKFLLHCCTNCPHISIPIQE